MAKFTSETQLREEYDNLQKLGPEKANEALWNQIAELYRDDNIKTIMEESGLPSEFSGLVKMAARAGIMPGVPAVIDLIQRIQGIEGEKDAPNADAKSLFYLARMKNQLKGVDGDENSKWQTRFNTYTALVTEHFTGATSYADVFSSIPQSTELRDFFRGMKIIGRDEISGADADAAQKMNKNLDLLAAMQAVEKVVAAGGNKIKVGDIEVDIASEKAALTDPLTTDATGSVTDDTDTQNNKLIARKKALESIIRKAGEASPNGIMDAEGVGYSLKVFKRFNTRQAAFELTGDESVAKKSLAEVKEIVKQKAAEEMADDIRGELVDSNQYSPTKIGEFGAFDITHAYLSTNYEKYRGVMSLQEFKAAVGQVLLIDAQKAMSDPAFLPNLTKAGLESQSDSYVEKINTFRLIATGLQLEWQAMLGMRDGQSFTTQEQTQLGNLVARLGSVHKNEGTNYVSADETYSLDRKLQILKTIDLLMKSVGKPSNQLTLRDEIAQKSFRADLTSELQELRTILADGSKSDEQKIEAIRNKIQLPLEARAGMQLINAVSFEDKKGQEFDTDSVLDAFRWNTRRQAYSELELSMSADEFSNERTRRQKLAEHFANKLKTGLTSKTEPITVLVRKEFAANDFMVTSPERLTSEVVTKLMGIEALSKESLPNELISNTTEYRKYLQSVYTSAQTSGDQKSKDAAIAEINQFSTLAVAKAREIFGEEKIERNWLGFKPKPKLEQITDQDIANWVENFETDLTDNTFKEILKNQIVEKLSARPASAQVEAVLNDFLDGEFGPGLNAAGRRMVADLFREGGAKGYIFNSGRGFSQDLGKVDEVQDESYEQKASLLMNGVDLGRVDIEKGPGRIVIKSFQGSGNTAATEIAIVTDYNSSKAAGLLGSRLGNQEKAAVAYKEDDLETTNAEILKQVIEGISSKDKIVNSPDSDVPVTPLFERDNFIAVPKFVKDSSTGEIHLILETIPVTPELLNGTLEREKAIDDYVQANMPYLEHAAGDKGKIADSEAQKKKLEVFRTLNSLALEDAIANANLLDTSGKPTLKAEALRTLVQNLTDSPGTLSEVTPNLVSGQILARQDQLAALTYLLKAGSNPSKVKDKLKIGATTKSISKINDELIAADDTARITILNNVSIALNAQNPSLLANYPSEVPQFMADYREAVLRQALIEKGVKLERGVDVKDALQDHILEAASKKLSAEIKTRITTAKDANDVLGILDATFKSKYVPVASEQFVDTQGVVLLGQGLMSYNGGEITSKDQIQGLLSALGPKMIVQKFYTNAAGKDTTKKARFEILHKAMINNTKDQILNLAAGGLFPGGNDEKKFAMRKIVEESLGASKELEVIAFKEELLAELDYGIDYKTSFAEVFAGIDGISALKTEQKGVIKAALAEINADYSASIRTSGALAATGIKGVQNVFTVKVDPAGNTTSPAEVKFEYLAQVKTSGSSDYIELNIPGGKVIRLQTNANPDDFIVSENGKAKLPAVNVNATGRVADLKQPDQKKQAIEQINAELADQYLLRLGLKRGEQFAYVPQVTDIDPATGKPIEFKIVVLPLVESVAGEMATNSEVAVQELLARPEVRNAEAPYRIAIAKKLVEKLIGGSPISINEFHGKAQLALVEALKSGGSKPADTLVGDIYDVLKANEGSVKTLKGIAGIEISKEQRMADIIAEVIKDENLFDAAGVLELGAVKEKDLETLKAQMNKAARLQNALRSGVNANFSDAEYKARTEKMHKSLGAFFTVALNKALVGVQYTGQDVNIYQKVAVAENILKETLTGAYEPVQIDDIRSSVFRDQVRGSQAGRDRLRNNSSFVMPIYDRLARTKMSLAEFEEKVQAEKEHAERIYGVAMSRKLVELASGTAWTFGGNSVSDAVEKLWTDNKSNNVDGSGLMSEADQKKMIEGLIKEAKYIDYLALSGDFNAQADALLNQSGGKGVSGAITALSDIGKDDYLKQVNQLTIKRLAKELRKSDVEISLDGTKTQLKALVDGKSFATDNTKNADRQNALKTEIDALLEGDLTGETVHDKILNYGKTPLEIAKEKSLEVKRQSEETLRRARELAGLTRERAKESRQVTLEAQKAAARLRDAQNKLEKVEQRQEVKMAEAAEKATEKFQRSWLYRKLGFDRDALLKEKQEIQKEQRDFIERMISKRFAYELGQLDKDISSAADLLKKEGFTDSDKVDSSFKAMLDEGHISASELERLKNIIKADSKYSQNWGAIFDKVAGNPELLAKALFEGSMSLEGTELRLGDYQERILKHVKPATGANDDQKNATEAFKKNLLENARKGAVANVFELARAMGRNDKAAFTVAEKFIDNYNSDTDPDPAITDKIGFSDALKASLKDYLDPAKRTEAGAYQPLKEKLDIFKHRRVPFTNLPLSMFTQSKERRTLSREIKNLIGDEGAEIPWHNRAGKTLIEWAAGRTFEGDVLKHKHGLTKALRFAVETLPIVLIPGAGIGAKFLVREMARSYIDARLIDKKLQDEGKGRLRRTWSSVATRMYPRMAYAVARGGLGIASLGMSELYISVATGLYDIYTNRKELNRQDALTLGLATAASWAAGGLAGSVATELAGNAGAMKDMIRFVTNQGFNEAIFSAADISFNRRFAGADKAKERILRQNLTRHSRTLASMGVAMGSFIRSIDENSLEHHPAFKVTGLSPRQIEGRVDALHPQEFLDALGLATNNVLTAAGNEVGRVANEIGNSIGGALGGIQLPQVQIPGIPGVALPQVNLGAIDFGADGDGDGVPDFMDAEPQNNQVQGFWQQIPQVQPQQPGQNNPGGQPANPFAGLGQFFQNVLGQNNAGGGGNNNAGGGGNNPFVPPGVVAPPPAFNVQQNSSHSSVEYIGQSPDGHFMYLDSANGQVIEDTGNDHTPVQDPANGRYYAPAGTTFDTLTDGIVNITPTPELNADIVNAIGNDMDVHKDPLTGQNVLVLRGSSGEVQIQHNGVQFRPVGAAGQGTIDGVPLEYAQYSADVATPGVSSVEARVNQMLQDRGASADFDKDGVPDINETQGGVANASVTTAVANVTPAGQPGAGVTPPQGAGNLNWLIAKQTNTYELDRAQAAVDILQKFPTEYASILSQIDGNPAAPAFVKTAIKTADDGTLISIIAERWAAENMNNNSKTFTIGPNGGYVVNPAGNRLDTVAELEGIMNRALIDYGRNPTQIQSNNFHNDVTSIVNGPNVAGGVTSLPPATGANGMVAVLSNGVTVTPSTFVNAAGQAITDQEVLTLLYTAQSQGVDVSNSAALATWADANPDIVDAIDDGRITFSMTPATVNAVLTNTSSNPPAIALPAALTTTNVPSQGFGSFVNAYDPVTGENIWNLGFLGARSYLNPDGTYCVTVGVPFASGILQTLFGQSELVLSPSVSMADLNNIKVPALVGLAWGATLVGGATFNVGKTVLQRVPPFNFFFGRK